MSHQTMKLFSVLFFAEIVLAGTRTAYAFEITQAEPNSSVVACMDVAGAHTNSGTAVEAYPCNGAFNEQWSDVASELQGLGTSAGGANCADANGNLVILDACASPPPATWYFYPGDQITGAGGNCLDSQSQYGSGAQIALKPCNNTQSQVWVVKDIVIAQAIPNQIDNACVDVQNQAINNNTPVLANPCTLGIGERWTYINGELRGIGSSDGKSTCLGTKETKGVYLVGLQTCTNNNYNQVWYIVSGTDTSGHYGVQLLNGATGGCLDSKGNYGAQLVVGSSICNAEGATSQLWTLR